MTPADGILIVAAAFAAGAINAVVGSGSLITFPTLLFLGYPPLVANVSNTVGLVSGSVSAAFGYRRELAGQRVRAVPLLVAGALGGLTGGLLLLVLPATAFARVVPVLLLVASGLVAIQPRLSAWIEARRKRAGATSGSGRAVVVWVFVTGIYGGYFGAAQSVILFAILATLIVDSLQRLNGLKNLITAVVNGVAAILFLIVAPVDLSVAAAIALGSTFGGLTGARLGRRLPAQALRAAVVLAGAVVALKLVVA